MFYDDLEKENLVLFLGEGNFSFSANVVKKLNCQNLSNIYTSCFEKQDIIDEVKLSELCIAQAPSKKLEKSLIAKSTNANPIKLENMQYLQSCGCNVLQGVDGEALDQDSRLNGLLFSKVIFMFPHVGGKMKIGRNRKLLLNVLKSAKKILRKNGQIVITLCRGKDGDVKFLKYYINFWPSNKYHISDIIQYLIGFLVLKR